MWESAFALGGIQDLSAIYPSLESFFVRRLGLKKASPTMLINEVKRMAGATEPRTADIKSRLIEISIIISRVHMTTAVERALETLKDVAFLPKKVPDGTLVLVKTTDSFAISDHERYGSALAGHGVLLDVSVNEVQSLHLLFQHLRITDRYISELVQEVSTVGDDATEHENLTKKLQEKAYALYW